MIDKIIIDINSFANTGNIEFNKKILQIVPGGYGENDQLLGISVPVLRNIAKKYYHDISLNDISYLLKSSIHEYRLLAVIFMTMIYEKNEKDIFSLYLNNIEYLNNWDIIDVSCFKIVGKYLFDHYSDDESLSFLKKLYDSSNFWQRRIAIVSTFYFIKHDKPSLILSFFENVVSDPHHLNNKALGWMLREVGKKDKNLLLDFLKKYRVANITFNYATEKLTKAEKEELKSLIV